jgi:hypothetical protein
MHERKVSSRPPRVEALVAAVVVVEVAEAMPVVVEEPALAGALVVRGENERPADDEHAVANTPSAITATPSKRFLIRRPNRIPVVRERGSGALRSVGR